MIRRTVVLLVAMVATASMIGCFHGYRIQYGINEQGGFVQSNGRPDSNDLRILYNEKAWSDSFWKAQYRHLNIKATNESLMVLSYADATRRGLSDGPHMGIIINECGPNHYIRVRGRDKKICPTQIDTIFIIPRPDSKTPPIVIIDHYDQFGKLLYTREARLEIDCIRQNAIVAGIGTYDWSHRVYRY